jgi:hypothetical protein
MGFKKGDIVVCVDTKINENVKNFLIIKQLSKLKLNEKYLVYWCGGPEIALDNNRMIAYSTHRFKLLSEVRKEKLKQLRNGI